MFNLPALNSSNQAIEFFMQMDKKERKKSKGEEKEHTAARKRGPVKDKELNDNRWKRKGEWFH